MFRYAAPRGAPARLGGGVATRTRCGVSRRWAAGWLRGCCGAGAGARAVISPPIGTGAVGGIGRGRGVGDCASSAIIALVAGAMSLWGATTRSASMNAAPEPKRWSGRLASALAITTSSSRGCVGSTSDGGGGGDWTWATISCGVAPENGTEPVSTS